MNKIFLSVVVCFSFFTISSKAQSISCYPFNSVIGISSNPNRNLWLDVKLQTNSYFSSLSTEPALHINLNKNKLGKYYLGLGPKVNFLALAVDPTADVLEGYFFNAGVRSAPITKYPGIQFVFELSPFASSNFESGQFRSRLGLAYNFSK